jgi:hypothetical protein
VTQQDPGRDCPALERPRARNVWREPTIWILVAATTVHVIRENVVDIVVFAGTAVLVVVDSRRDDLHPMPLVDRFRRPLVAAVCAAYGLLVLPLSRTGWALPLSLALPGLVALALVWRVGRSPLELASGPNLARGRGWLAWPVVLVVGCLFELFNFVLQPDPQTDSYAHPTISALVDPMLGWPLSRAVAAALWLAIGIWLVTAIGRGDPEEER